MEQQVPKALWGMIAAAVIAAAALVLIIGKFDPYVSDWPVFALLFFSVFILVNSLLISAIYFYRLRRGIVDVAELFSVSMRQGLIFGSTITGLFIGQTLHVLTWWNGLLVVAIAVILDMYLKK